MTATSVPDLSGRRPPALGGFNLTALNLEIRRLWRNPRAVIITVIVPVIFFFAFGLNRTNTTGDYGHGNYAAWVLVSLALYGAIFSTTYTGAGVSVERAQGWSRQLRLTPLSPAGYIGMKVATALVLGLVWIGSLLFAAFGLFIGFLVPADAVPQLLGLIMSLFAFVGGLFIPISLLPQTIQDIAKWSPEYGLNQLVHAPLLGSGVDWTWVVNVIAWLAIFVVGAVWRFSKDTARV
jgi:ABC-2 type transport system permease protein